MKKWFTVFKNRNGSENLVEMLSKYIACDVQPLFMIAYSSEYLVVMLRKSWKITVLCWWTRRTSRLYIQNPINSKYLSGHLEVRKNLYITGR